MHSFATHSDVSNRLDGRRRSSQGKRLGWSRERANWLIEEQFQALQIFTALWKSRKKIFEATGSKAW